jgi:hypothetical protein
MTERTIFETVTDAEAEADLGGFADSDILMELREMITEIITECTEATTTGNDGCGCGSADVEFDLDGLIFNVSISLSEDEEIEH